MRWIWPIFHNLYSLFCEWKESDRSILEDGKKILIDQKHPAQDPTEKFKHAESYSLNRQMWSLNLTEKKIITYCLLFPQKAVISIRR